MNPRVTWRRSSWCSGPHSTCVEVAVARLATRVRDAKQEDGPVLSFDADAWLVFVGRLTRERPS